jgi:hypothetical protein
MGDGELGLAEAIDVLRSELRKAQDERGRSTTTGPHGAGYTWDERATQSRDGHVYPGGPQYGSHGGHVL